MPQILELLENRNLTKAKASDAMVNMYFRNFRLLAGRNPRKLTRELLTRVHLGEELLPRKSNARRISRASSTLLMPL